MVSYINNFFKTMIGISKISIESNKQIEGVLLHIHARQNICQNNKDIVVSILLKLTIDLVLEIWRFVSYPITNTFRFLLCLSLPCLLYILSDALFVNQIKTYLYAYLIAYAISDLQHLLSTFRKIVFDILDIICFGQLTKIYSKFVIEAGREGCEHAIKNKPGWHQPESIAYFFYTNRIPFKPSSSLDAKTSEFMKLASEDEEKKIQQKCDDYWKQINKN